MKLDENFTIVGKEYEWTLKFSKETDQVNPKTGKLQVTTNQWHYARLKDALKKYMDEALKPSETIEEVIKRIEEVELLIEKLRPKQ